MSMRTRCDLVLGRKLGIFQVLQAEENHFFFLKLLQKCLLYRHAVATVT